MLLQPGDKVPGFTVVDAAGNEVTESIFKQGRTLLFFYPKANTAGCSMEAAGFAGHHQQMNELGVAVVGASADRPKANLKFKQKYALPYPLLCDDEDKTLCKAFGVWQQKKMAGREYMGIVRTSFLIREGVVEKVYAKVKAKVHPDLVLDELSRAG